MNIISNEELYKLARAGSTTFAEITPESYEEFAHKIAGLETAEAKELINTFTGTLLMLYLNRVEGVRAKNPYDKNGLIEKFFVPFKGIKENMYIRTRKPINPKYKVREDGTSVDMQLFTKPVTEAIYYTFNDDYQNTRSIPTDDMKTAVADNNGYNLLVNGYMQALAAEYTQWEREHTANTINVMLNDANEGVRAEQVIEVEFADAANVTRDELKNFVNTVNNTVEAMDLIETDAFNIAKFPKYVDKSDLVLMVKPGIKQTLKTQLLESAFNKEDLNLEVEPMVVPDFGGLVPTSDGTLAGKLYMVYDAQGRPTDTYTTDEQGQTPFTGEVKWYDPNEDVLAVLCEKGTIFIDDQNPYEVGAAPYNYAGRYVTYWANKPNVGFHFDKYKNCVVIKKK